MPCTSRALVPLFRYTLISPNHQRHITMSDNFAKAESPEPTADFSDGPSVSQAANDLRTAAGEKAKDIVHHTAEQAKMAKDRAVESAQQFRDAATEKAHGLKDAANVRAAQIRTSADEQWHQTRDKAKELHITVEDYVRQNPTKSVVSALGVGFLIGLIARR
jgi:ElaB/YqjD/DUF883 family membrane-anchored ribosome-binding protein